MENGNTIKGAGKLRVFSFVERFRKPLPGELSEWVRVGTMRDTLASAAGLVSRAKEALDVVSKELRRGVEDVRHSECQ